MHKFTVAQILDAAEKNRYKNFNSRYIEYDDNGNIVQACVIGEAFLNLGLVENGTDAGKLSWALEDIKPDNGLVEINSKKHDTLEYRDLSMFINDLNNYAGYRGKKRIVRLARKYFSKSLDQVVEF